MRGASWWPQRSSPNRCSGWIERNDDEVLMDQQVTISPPAFQIIEREAFTVLGVEEDFALIERNDPGFVKIWLERFEA